MKPPVLVACSHGTRSVSGRTAIHALLDQVRRLLPDTSVLEAFVDVQEPNVADVVTAIPDAAVVVPVLLSTGFHTRVDIARSVRDRPDVIATPPLGPHDLLALTLAERLEEAGLQGDDAVILAAAGSSDPAAEADVSRMADLLAHRIGRPVTVGFAAGAHPRIGAAVAQARVSGASRVVAASYVLAPGHFADVIAAAGADAVTAPLAPDDRVAAIVAERYRTACASLAVPSRVGEG